MLTSLSFLSPGENWPPKAEANRLIEYNENFLIRKNKYKELSQLPDWQDLNRFLREDAKKSMKLFLGFFSLITRTENALLWGTPPEITADNESDSAALDDLIDSTKLQRIRKEVGWDVSSVGNGIFKIYSDSDGNPHIEANSPDIWYPIVEDGAIRNVKYHALITQVSIDDKAYLKAEIHGKDAIEYRVYELQTSSANGVATQIGDLVSADIGFDLPSDAKMSIDGLSKYEDNPIGEFLVIVVNNLRLSNDIYGQSDYSPDLKSILKQILDRYNQTNRVLDKHVDSNIVAPKGSFKEWDPALQKNIARAGGRLIEYDLDPGVSAPNIYYLESQQLAANTGAGDVQIQRLEMKFCALSGMPPQYFGLELAGTAESGTALYYKMANLLSRVNDLKEEFDEALTQVIRVATKLTGNEIVPSIKWNSGLQIPFAENAQSVSMLVSSGLWAGEEATIQAMLKLGYSREVAEKVAMDSSRSMAGGM